jgi:outer membrane protein assembly factor BamB
VIRWTSIRLLTLVSFLLIATSGAFAADAVDYAASQIGKPYLWGASGTEEFDCSSLTQYAYAQVGISLPRTSFNQSKSGTLVSGELQHGDLLFFQTDPEHPGLVTHVGIYDAGQQMIDANSYVNKVVRESITTSYWQSRFLFARRVAPQGPNQSPTAGFTMSFNGQSATDGQTLNLTIPAGTVINVNFSGARSSDQDGAVSAWEWRINGTRVPNSDFTGRDFVFGLGLGVHLITLVVTDNQGARSQAAQGTVSISTATPIDEGWRMDRFNAARTNTSLSSGPQTLPQFTAIGSTNTDEQLLRISNAGDLVFKGDQSVSSYNSAGQLKWRRNIGTTILDVALANDGTVYVSTSNSVIAFNGDNGLLRWPRALVTNNGNESSPLAVAPDGTIYFLSGSSFVGFNPPNITAINPDGTKKFVTTANFGWGRGYTGVTLNSSASVIYSYLFPSALMSLSSFTGNLIATNNSCTSGGAIEFTPSGMLLGYGSGNNLTQYDESLSTCSTIPLGSSIFRFVAVTPSNKLIFQIFSSSTTQGQLAAATSSGTRVWTSNEFYATGSAFGQPCFMDGASRIYCIADDTNDIVAIDSESGAVKWRSHFASRVSNVMLSGGGKLYVVSAGQLFRN